MLLFAFIAIAAASPTEAKPIDIASWFTPDDYPAEAWKKGVEGVVGFEIDVDRNGKQTACRITKSSGSDLLDGQTCRIVMERARFTPARSNGKPVAGRYSSKTTWSMGLAAAGPANDYFATIVDLSKNPNHPECSVIGRGISGGPGCAAMLQGLIDIAKREKLTKIVALTTLTTGDQTPYRGEASWGERLSFAAVELYPPKQGGGPTCAVVSKEGALEADPCAHYADASSLSEKDKESAYKAHVEQSLFGVRMH